MRDPQNAPIKAYCDHCGLEIYSGMEVYEICDSVIHEDCLVAFAGRLKIIEEVVG